MIIATSLTLLVAAGLFCVRFVLGPSMADRVIGLNGLILVGMAAIITHAVATGTGAFLPALVAVALVGPISNAMIARFLEGRRP